MCFHRGYNNTWLDSQLEEMLGQERMGRVLCQSVLTHALPSRSSSGMCDALPTNRLVVSITTMVVQLELLTISLYVCKLCREAAIPNRVNRRINHV